MFNELQSEFHTLLFLLVCATYFIPSLVAAKRGHKNGLAIGVTNLLLGWTVIGWIVSLVWASTANTKEAK